MNWNKTRPSVPPLWKVLGRRRRFCASVLGPGARVWRGDVGTGTSLIVDVRGRRQRGATCISAAVWIVWTELVAHRTVLDVSARVERGCGRRESKPVRAWRLLDDVLERRRAGGHVVLVNNIERCILERRR